MSKCGEMYINFRRNKALPNFPRPLRERVGKAGVRGKI
jgi:hypothetical protein